MSSDIIHVVYASDEKFIWILSVALVSLYENNRDLREIYVYILDGGISAENRKEIESISDKYGRSNPLWIVSRSIIDELSMNVIVDRGSLSQYARLFIATDLPDDLDRVLYLDCDTIVNASIKELWNLNLGENIIAALMDAFSKHYRKNIGLEENDVMFNSGVMLIDLKKWRSQHIEEKLKDFIRKKRGKIQQGDQGVLNAVLSKDVFCFEPRFNAVTIFFDFNYQEILIYRKPPRFYAYQEIETAVEDPVIVHFTSSVFSKRPWIRGCKHKYVNLWMKYKEISPWKDRSLLSDNRSKLKMMVEVVIKILPRNIVIKIAGLLQVYARPMIYFIIDKLAVL